MPFEKNYDVPEPIAHSPCRHLRSKAIYVTGSLVNPNHPDEEGSHYCWCNITQHVIGPDRVDVRRRDCCPGRGCYEAST